MNLWEELLAIASSISFSEEKDSLIWELNSQGVYSVQTLYAIVSVRGIKQVYTPMMWKLRVPPRIHVFLWLLANNKLLTRGNLAKRKEIPDKTCLFCSEHESVHHIMFDCCVAKLIWGYIAEACDVDLGLTLSQWRIGGLGMKLMLT